MNAYRFARETAAGAVLLVACTGVACGQATQPDCVQPPCPLPLAIVVSVTSPAGAAVEGVTVAVSGAVNSSAPCAVSGGTSVCRVQGTPGTYTLMLTAPGFLERTLTVSVPGNTPTCGCPTVTTQQVTVTLTPR